MTLHSDVNRTYDHPAQACRSTTVGALERQRSIALCPDPDENTDDYAGHGTDGRFPLDAPHKASFVSLRATAKDSAGNAVHQPVIRAFGLR